MSRERPTPKDRSRWMKYIRRRGFDTERILQNELRRHGIWAKRIPASGMWESRKKQSLPDVFALRSDGLIIGFQVKATGAARFSFSPRDLAPLRDFVSDVASFGYPVWGIVIVRFVRDNNSFWAGTRLDIQDVVVEHRKDPQNPRRVKVYCRFASPELAEKYEFNVVQHGYGLTKLLHKLGVIK